LIEESYGHHEIAGFEGSSIEHVMPQTLTPEWYETLGIDAAEVHAEWLHTIGNLTLTGYNPELSNRSYCEKRTLFALSHFELNRHFGDYERWSAADVEFRAKSMFKIAIQLWPRPETPIVESPPALQDKSTPAAFHSDCVKMAQQHLCVHLSKLSQTRYESGDGHIRLMCAVSATHNESGEVPYFWFALHNAQLEFLDTAKSPYICLGCSSAKTTLLVPKQSGPAQHHQNRGPTVLAYSDSEKVRKVRHPAARRQGRPRPDRIRYWLKRDISYFATKLRFYAQMFRIDGAYRCDESREARLAPLIYISVSSELPTKIGPLHHDLVQSHA
jgi:hypothetical protein